TLISGCRESPAPPGLTPHKKKLGKQMRKKETLAGVAERIEAYDRFFQTAGYECPLPKHLKRTLASGFYKYSLLIDAHFLAEMCSGTLVAVADFDRFEGALRLDLAEEGERSLGMGARELVCRAGEIVLRDEKDIVCVLLQGADEKTRVRPETTSVCYYTYAVPGVGPEHLEQGLRIAAETATRFGGGAVEVLEIY
ncbi:MAG: hypothetical protein KKB20_26950, partial [Proteobacteria bacterium]|nr:hypothetical protein [Pseudomonadota bacterium]